MSNNDNDNDNDISYPCATLRPIELVLNNRQQVEVSRVGDGLRCQPRWWNGEVSSGGVAQVDQTTNRTLQANITKKYKTKQAVQRGTQDTLHPYHITYVFAKEILVTETSLRVGTENAVTVVVYISTIEAENE